MDRKNQFEQQERDLWELDNIENKSTGIQILSEETKWKIVSTLVPAHSLLATKLWDWYDENPYHKYNEWDILILSNSAYWYGINPVAVVEWYSVEDDSFSKSWKSGKYRIKMFRSLNDQESSRSISDDECHFKWNIENQFKKVNAKTPEEALELYK